MATASWRVLRQRDRERERERESGMLWAKSGDVELSVLIDKLLPAISRSRKRFGMEKCRATRRSILILFLFQRANWRSHYTRRIDEGILSLPGHFRRSPSSWKTWKAYSPDNSFDLKIILNLSSDPILLKIYWPDTVLSSGCR
jgi:hypothetical protein